VGIYYFTGGSNEVKLTEAEGRLYHKGYLEEAVVYEKY